MTDTPEETPWADLSLEEQERRYGIEVSNRAFHLGIEADARALLAERQNAARVQPELVSLFEFLQEEDEDPGWRIDQLLPTGGNIVFAAQQKAGKSTGIANAIRALADGKPFLDRFHTRPGSVVLLDLELDKRTLRRWLRDQGTLYTKNVYLISLRGRVSSFNILDPAILAEWAITLSQIDVLIFDCLRPVLDALGLSEDKDAGKFFVALDALKMAADIQELIVVHHMGHTGERSRGDSRILDWPDATWKLVREDDDPASRRYFSAFGRDVDIPESLLGYDPETRRLTLGVGNRQQAASDTLVPVVLALLVGKPHGMSGRAIVDALGEHPKNQVQKATKRGIEIGRIRTEPGINNSIIHRLVDDELPIWDTR